MSALSPLPVGTVRQEATVLRALLQDGLWNLELQPVQLGPDESPLLRTFWEAVGWDEQLAGDLGPPQLEASRRLVQKLLSDHRRWGSPLQPSALPARYRVVGVDSEGTGFTVTDESSGDPDPPVIGLFAESGTAERVGDSYLRWATYALLFAATRPWYDAFLRTEPPLDELIRERPLPNLAPGAGKLSDDLWLLPAEPETPSSSGRLAIRSFEGLWRWLEGDSPLRHRVLVQSLPGRRFKLTASVDDLRAGTPGWREVEAFAPAIAYRLGRLDAAPVIVQLGTPSTLACSRRDEGALTEWLVARGWVAG